ncbi:MAG: hypothetical protein IH577_04120 [Deltaproteobacteria bacterium]|nr:hypothetical protein [Deltaproteobacteria bacterium]
MAKVNFKIETALKALQGSREGTTAMALSRNGYECLVTGLADATVDGEILLSDYPSLSVQVGANYYSVLRECSGDVFEIFDAQSNTIAALVEAIKLAIAELKTVVH